MRHADFAAASSGDLILPSDEAYDVIGAVGVARGRDLVVAIRGGGHGVAGTASVDGGFVIDLRHMNTVTVDPDAHTATVAGGATMGDLDRATAPMAWPPPVGGCRPLAWPG